MRVLLIDDEPDALDNLEIMLSDWTTGIDVVGKANSVASGLDLLAQTKADVLFLDVELKDGTGFDLLEKAPEQSCRVIFCTSHDQYLLRALRLSALDFLLKPIDPDELQQAVERARQSLNKEEEAMKRQVLKHNLASEAPERLVVSDKNNIYLIDLNDILYCKGEGNYTTFHLQNESPIVISKHLKTYEKILLGDKFFRVHNSFIVSLKQVKRIEKGTSDMLIMTNGDKVPIATRRKSDVINILTA